MPQSEIPGGGSHAFAHTVFSWTIIFISALFCGCSGEYPRKELGEGSPRATKVRDMIHSLRTASADELEGVIDSQVVSAGVNDGGRREMAIFTLKQIAAASEVDVLMLDQYGGNVVRATLRLTENNRPRTVCMLLIVDSQGNLRWAGPS